MNNKAKILSTLVIASIASALLTGVILVILHTFVDFSQINNMGVTLIVAAIVLYLLGGFIIIGLLNFLLDKKVIIQSTERTMLENERTMLTEQLHHAQKMEAVGRLAGSIAHDFNNLLTIIDGYASLISADPQSKDTDQHVKEIIEAARKASFITRKLLGFSQKEKAEPVLLDLNTTLQDTDKMLSRLIGEKITLVTKPYDEPIYVKADPVQLGQVLMNLAVNARDAMPNGGRITIKIGSRLIERGECAKPDRVESGHYAEISVYDTGHGMDTETVARIFEAFFTTKEKGKGTGLGLSIVKSIMKESGGFIDVKSKPNAGTTFYIYLPLADAEEVENTLEPAPEILPPPVAPDIKSENISEDSKGPATILLVEDDPMIRTLCVQTLEQQKYNVLVAEEGWEGIKVARNHKGKIDLLFTDVVMPSLGGAELAVAAKELYPDIKVLFMSGYSRAQLKEEGVPEDAPLLEKPFTPSQMVAMLKQQLKG